MHRLLIAAYALVLLIMLVLGGFWIRFLSVSDSDLAEVRESRDVLQVLNEMKVDVLSAAAAQRGYLVTGRDVLRLRHEQESQSVQEASKRFVAMRTSYPAQMERISQINAMALDWFEKGRHLMEVRDNIGLGAAQVILVNSIGVASGDALLELIELAQKDEESLLASRRAALNSSRDRITQMAMFSSLAIALLLAVLGLVIRKELVARTERIKQLDDLAHHDVLTGLANRRLFSNYAESMLALAERKQTQLAVLMLDLDGFKAVNDRFGHDIGDLILQEVALRLQNSLRASDLVARFGGDEFAILLPGVTNSVDTQSIAEKLIVALEEPYTIGEVPQQQRLLSACIGIAFFPEHGQALDALMSHADAAMYVAKQNGKGHYRLYADQGAKFS